MASSRRHGKILTFYSYKGGTGRSMALANVGWLLAASGAKVLMIDWDLEAPGLHRYLHPFLADPDLTASDGVIDYVWQFTVTATSPDRRSDRDRAWIEEAADLGRCSLRIDYPFDRGALDFIPAGRQGASYSQRVNTFDWQGFYTRLGGSRLLAADREELRKTYDYVLIDSRTGVSDTSGICTVDLPDSLVACFTCNNQSIAGAAAVVHSVLEQRADRLLDVFPVLMRVELAEKDKLDSSRRYARSAFAEIIPSGSAPNDYWSRAEVLYQPYYAYEEILAAFGDPPGSSKTLLSDMVELSRLVTGAEVDAPSLPDAERRHVRDRFSRQGKQEAVKPHDFAGSEAQREFFDRLLSLSQLWQESSRDSAFLLEPEEIDKLALVSEVLGVLRSDDLFDDFYSESLAFNYHASKLRLPVRVGWLSLLTVIAAWIYQAGYLSANALVGYGILTLAAMASVSSSGIRSLLLLARWWKVALAAGFSALLGLLVPHLLSLSSYTAWFFMEPVYWAVLILGTSIALRAELGTGSPAPLRVAIFAGVGAFAGSFSWLLALDSIAPGADILSAGGFYLILTIAVALGARHAYSLSLPKVVTIGLIAGCCALFGAAASSIFDSGQFFYFAFVPGLALVARLVSPRLPVLRLSFWALAALLTAAGVSLSAGVEYEDWLWFVGPVQVSSAVAIAFRWALVAPCVAVGVQVARRTRVAEPASLRRRNQAA